MTDTGAGTPLDILGVIDGIVDDTHPEGDGCPLCVALDDLRDALTSRPATDPAGLDVERLAEGPGPEERT